MHTFYLHDFLEYMQKHWYQHVGLIAYDSDS